MDGGEIAEIVEQVPVGAFYDLRHQQIYEACKHLYSKRLPVNTLTVWEAIKSVGNGEECGGLSYVTSLPDAIPSAHGVQTFIDKVLEHYTRRQYIQAASQVVNIAFDHGTLSRPELIDEVEKLFSIIVQQARTKTERSMSELVQGAISRLEEWYNTLGGVRGLKTGFSDFDKMTNGFRPGQMLVMAGRPGVGKTTFACNILEYVSLTANAPAGMFSLEMSDEELVMRLLCAHSRVVISHIQEGFFTERDFPRLTGSAGKLSKAPIYIDDTPGLTIFQIRSRARKWKQQHGIKFLVVDYLQLVHSELRRDNREREVADVSLGMKELAKELELPILVLSQLNRASEREGRRPMLSDLRESGAIEQDADLVAFLYREAKEDDDPDAEAFAVKLRIEKQRSGPTGTVNLTFLRNISRFEQAAKINPEDVPSVKQGDNIP